MKLTADSKPFHLRKELNLPREKCKLHAKAGNVSFSWPVGGQTPDVGVDYDPTVAQLQYNPQEYLHIFFDFIASKVDGNPPQRLKLAAYMPDGKLRVVELKRPKGSDEISTADILSVVEDFTFDFEADFRNGHKLPDWMRGTLNHQA